MSNILLTPWSGFTSPFLISWSLLKVMLIEFVIPSVSSSVIPFSSCLQSFPESGSFPMSWLFVSGGQSIGASASASVLPINTQGWFPLGLADLISLLPKGLTRVFCSTTIWKHQLSDTQPSLCIYDHNFQSKCKN